MVALRRPVLVLAVTLVAAWAGARVAAGSSHAPLPMRTSTGLAGCGYERWPVKTLADRSGRAVDLTRRVTSAIFRLDRLRVARGGQTTRAGAERRTYTVRAVLMAAKVEDDSDVHLELRDPAYPAATLIAELPALRCTLGARPAVRRQIARARVAFLHACGDPGTSFSLYAPGTKLVVTGVGFFDRGHGQRGVAPNAFELHPVVGLRLLTRCRAV